VQVVCGVIVACCQQKKRCTCKAVWQIHQYLFDMVACLPHDPLLFPRRNPGPFTPASSSPLSSPVHIITYYHKPGMASRTWTLSLKPKFVCSLPVGPCCRLVRLTMSSVCLRWRCWRVNHTLRQRCRSTAHASGSTSQRCEGCVGGGGGGEHGGHRGTLCQGQGGHRGACERNAGCLPMVHLLVYIMPGATSIAEVQQATARVIAALEGVTV